MVKFTEKQSFGIYWDRARFYVRGLLHGDHDATDLVKDQNRQIKHLAYKCWRAGRKYERRRLENLELENETE